MDSSTGSLAMPLSSHAVFGQADGLGQPWPTTEDAAGKALGQGQSAWVELEAWQRPAPSLNGAETSLLPEIDAIAVVSPGSPGPPPGADAVTGLGGGQTLLSEDGFQPPPGGAASPAAPVSRPSPVGPSLVIIDAAVADAQALVEGLGEGHEVVVLNAEIDGIEQITALLAGRQGVAALHIVSHGRAGALQLGSRWVTAEDLGGYGDRLQSWKAALDNDADLLFYGCNLAEGETGAAFVQQLSELTGADVAASHDLTGDASQGGDWELEVVVGRLETALAFDRAAQQSYGHLLDVITSTTADETLTGTANDDTFVFVNGWGNDSINGGGGTNTLDFSAVTASLTFTVDAAGNVAVSDGTNSLTATGDVVAVVGGTAADVLNFGSVSSGLAIAAEVSGQLTITNSGFSFGANGVEALQGGSGTDSLTVDAAGNGITTAAGSVTVDRPDPDADTTISFDGAIEQVTVTNSIAGVDTTALAAGVQALATFGDRLETHGDFAATVPLTPSGGRDTDTPYLVSDLADPGQVLQRFQADLAAAAPADSATLESFLASWSATITDASLGNITVVADAAAVETTDISIAPDGTQTAASRVKFTANRVSQSRLADVLSLQDRGFAFDAAATFVLNTVTTFDLSLGLGSDFAVTVNELSVAIDEGAIASNTGLQVGILDSIVSDSNIDLEIDIATNFLSTGVNGATLSSTELQTANDGETADLEALLGFTATGSLNANFTVTPRAQAGFTAPAAALLEIERADIFDATVLEPSIQLADSLLSFTHLSADDLLSPLEQFERWLEDLEASSLYDGAVPLVDGVRVGDLLDFSGLLRQQLIEQVSERTQITALGRPLDPSTGQPSFELPNGTSFTLTVNGTDSTINLGTSTAGNSTLADLIGDINAAIAAAGLASRVQAEALLSSPSLITFTAQTPASDKIDLSFATADIATAFGFGSGQNADNVATFSTIQAFTAALGNLTGLATTTTYDPVNNRITFGVSLGEDSAAITKPFKQTLGLGEIDALTSSSPVTLDAELALDFSYGYDLTPLGLPTLAPLEEPQGPLDISGGSLDYRFDLIVNGRLTQDIVVPRSATAGITALTVLADAFNQALEDRGLEALVNTVVMDEQLQFLTQSNQTTLILLVNDNDNPLTQNLGFVNGQRVGPELSPAFFEADNSELSATVRLDWLDSDASGRRGFVAFEFTEAAAQGTLTLSTRLNDTDGNGDGLISLLDLQVGARGSDRPVNQPVRSGALNTTDANAPDYVANAALRAVAAASPGSQFVLNLAGHVEAQDNIPANQLKLTTTGPDLTDSAIALQAQGNALSIFDQISADDIIEALEAASRAISAVSGDDVFSEVLPLLNLDAGGINDYGNAFSDLVADAALAPITSLQELARAINELMGLDVQAATFDPTTAGVSAPGIRFNFDGDVLEIDVLFSHEATRDYNFNLDLFGLAELDVNGVPAALNNEKLSILDSRGELDLDVKSTATLNLDLEIDYSGNEPVITLEDDSDVALAFRSQDDDLDFLALVGVSSLTVRDGAMVIDGDGDRTTTNDFARYSADFNGPLILDGRDLQSGIDFTTGLVGQAEIELPFFQNASVNSSLGDPLVIQILNLEDAAFGDAGAVNIPNPGNLPDLAPLAESQFLELLRNPDFLINALDRLLSAIQTAVEAPFAALENLPLIGDSIMDGVQPFFDEITQMRINIRNFLETAYAETIGQANDGDLIAILQEALFDLFAANDASSDTALDRNNDGLGPRLGILKDLQDDGDALTDIDDVVVTTFAGQGNDGVQYDFHLGQRYSIALPFELGFGVGDLGLDELLPGFGFNVDGGEGVTFDFSWDLRFGFGVSEQELFYVNTDQRENIADLTSDAIDELVLAIDVTVPGFNADVNLGLVGAKVSDGVEAPLRVTSLDAMGLSDVLLSNDNGLEGAFRVRLFKDSENGVLDTDPTILDFDNRDTGMRGGGILGTLDAPARAARLIAQLNLQLFELTTGGLIATPDLSAVLNEDHPDYDPLNPAARLILTARDPNITRIELEYIAGNSFGFGGSDGRQFEDQRAVGLGFDDSQAAVNGQIDAQFDAPKDGRLNQDVNFALSVAGTEVEVMLRASTLAHRAELANGAMVTGLAALAVQLNDAIALALLEAGLAANAVIATVQAGKLRLQGSSLERIEWSRLDISFLRIEFTTDLVDPDDAGRLTLPEIFSDPLATLEAKLAAEAQARLHVNTNADTVTDFVEDLIGFGGLGLPQVDFDFMVGFTGSIDISGGFETEYDISNLQFANIQVNVGELLSNLLGPVLGGVQTVLGPIFDILGPTANSAQGFLNAPIPVLSDLANLLGISSDFSLLDFTGNKQAFNQFFDVVTTIIDLIDAFNDIDFDDGPIIVNLGCWELDFDKKSPTYFPKTKLPLPCEVVDIFEDLGGEADPISRLLQLLGVSADGTANVDIEPGGIKLDFLDPGNILNLILGETFDIVSINLPKLELELGLNLGFDFKALNFGIGGGLTVDVDLGFVYDSTGLDRIMEARNLGLEPDYGDLLDGFYIRTKRGAEFSLGANFYGRGGISIRTPRICVPLLGCTPAFTIFALEAEAYGNFSLGLDLRDPNEDGALRFDEIMDLTNDFSDPERLFFLFDIVGSANFGFDFSGVILGQRITASDLGIKLDIGGSFSAQDFFGTIFGLEDPFTGTLGEIVGGKTNNPSRILRINAGEFAYARIHGDTDDSDGVKNWTVRSSGNDVIISDGSRSTTIANATNRVDSILFRGTNADDSIDFSGLALPITVDARGGIGNDRIIGGSGNDLILGGSGRDVVEGKDGDDALYGDEGEDDLQGGAGNDILLGGRDNDSLAGGAGADLYRYGTTRSERSGWGQDTVQEAVQISAVTAGTNGAIRITAAGHGLSNGDVITLSGLEGVTNNGAAVEGAFVVTRAEPGAFELENTSVGGSYISGTGAFFQEARLLDIASVSDEFAYVSDTGTVSFNGRSFGIENLSTEAGVFRITAFQHGLRTGDRVTVTGVEGATNANGSFEILKVSDNRFDLKASSPHPAGQIRITSPNHGLTTGDRISITGVGGVSNANGTYGITRLSNDQILLNGSKFIGSYERRNGSGFILAQSGRSQAVINADPASKLKLLTDSLDFSALGSNKPLNITLDTSGTRVEIGSEAVAVNTVRLANHQVETILGGRGEDTYNISANPSHFTRLNGQEGGDDYLVQLSDDVKGDVLIEDQGEIPAIDRLLIEGKNDANDPDTVGISREAVFFGPGKSIEYSPGGADSGLEQIKIDLNQGDDTTNVESTPDNTSVAVNGGLGSDTFNVGVSLNDGGATTEANLNAIAGIPRSQGGAGPIFLSGFDQETEEDPDGTDVDRLNIFETTDTTGNNAANGSAGALTASALTGLGMDVGIEYGAMERLDLRLGQGDDELTVTGLTTNSNSTIHGGGGSDNITVFGLTETGNQALTVYGDTSADGEHRVDGAGNDVVDASAVTRTIVLDGGGGDDTLRGGNAKDFIAGGSGNDQLFGNGGDDEIYGDAGFDMDLDRRAFTIHTSGRADGGNGNGDDFDAPGADSIEGGDGADILLGDQGLITRNTTVGLTTHVDLNDLGTLQRIETTNEALGGEDRISGGAGADLIFGGVSLVEHPDATVMGDEIDGGSGADIILGDAGIAHGSDGSADANDVLSRSPNLGGVDSIFGGEENDILIGGSLGDRILGGPGDDLILGDQGRITRNAADEIEVVETTDENSAGDDDLEGNDGQDVILGGSGADSAQGQADDDIILGDNGKVVFINNELDRVDTTVPGVGGDDRLLSGDEGNDIVLGGAGADTITGAAGDDILLGDNGSVIYGADGDRASLDAVTTPLSESDQGAGDTIDGGADDDILIGSVGDDLLYGRAGKDKLLGDNGQVQFTNGQLTEITTLNPDEAGQDELQGNEDEDVLLGGSGDDSLLGQGGNDILLGDNGRVLFNGGVIRRIETTEAGIGGIDNISGDIGADIGLGGFGDDRLEGGADDDTLLGDNGYLDYGVDSDLTTLDIIATPDNDSQLGGQDILTGNEGDDRLLGGANDDALIGGKGHDQLIGDNGKFSFTAGQLTRLESLDPSVAGQDNLEGNEDNDVLLGGLGNDQLQGQSGNDILFGDGAVVSYNNRQILRLESEALAVGGQDQLNGGEGNDIAFGGSGEDEINGQAGDDILLGDNGHLDYSLDGNLDTLDEIATPAEASIAALGGIDTLNGGAGDDIILGAAEGDKASGGDGADIILGDNGKLSYGGGILNRVTTELPEMGGNDRLLGDEGEDLVLGGAGQDSIEGGGASDILLGDNGQADYPSGVISQVKTTQPGIGDNDEIDGGNGLDWILGGAGADRLYGQAGNDRILGDHGIADLLLNTLTSTDPTLGGADRIFGGIGEDTLFGGTHGDRIHGDEFDLGDGQWRIVAIADFDRDGSSDSLWRDLTSGELAIQYIVSNGVNVTQQLKAADIRGSGFNIVGSGDFNGDGWVDIVWRNRQSGLLDVWLMERERQVGTAALSLPPLGLEWDVAAVADFNRDGQADLLLRHSLVPIDLLWFMQGTSFSAQSTLLGSTPLPRNYELAGTGDFNRDGRIDILWRNGTVPEERVWFLDDADFIGESVLNALPSPDGSWQIAGSGDFNQDGNMDLLWQNQNDGLPVIWNLQAVQFVPSLFNAQLTEWQLVGSGDFNQDSQPDSVWRNNSTGQTALRLMNQGAILRDIFVGPLVFDSNWHIEAVEDFNGDGQVDLLWRNQAAAINLLWGFTGTALTSQGLLRASGVDSNWRIETAGDLNGDGEADILWRNRFDGTLLVWLMNQGVEFSSFVLQAPPLDLGWTVEHIVDLNQDGQADLLLRNQNSNMLLARFLTGLAFSGDGLLQLPSLPDQTWQLGAVDDFDGNGQLDLYWRNRVTGLALLWQLNGLAFQGQTPLSGGSDRGLVNWFLEGNALVGGRFSSRDSGWKLVGSADFNQDGQADGVWRNSLTGQTALRLMNGDEVLEDIFVGPTVFDPNWEIQAVGDFDGDGQADLLWRNQGVAQTILWSLDRANYRGSSLLPARAIDGNWRIAGSGDLNGDGQTDLLWRNQVDGALVSMLMDQGRDIQTQLLDTPPLDLSWAVEDLADLNGDGQLDLLLRNRINNVLLGRLLNGTQLLGDLPLQLPSLPDQSWQIGALADFGGDGALDLYWRNRLTGLELLWSLKGPNFTGQRIVYGQQTADLILGDHGQRDFNLPREESYLSIFTAAADGGGNDLIYGDQGDDKILGQQGDDLIFGGSGEDDLIGGHNVLGGVDGADRISGGAGADVILGDNGSLMRHALDPESRTWQRHSFPFADVIREVVRFDDADRVSGNDHLSGDAGDDIIHGQRGDDTIAGGAGDDELYGELGSDQIYGDGGHDTILGGTGLILRHNSPNGLPRQAANGAWHRDVILTQVASLADSRALAEAGLSAQELAQAELLLLSGLYNPNGARSLNPDGSWQTLQQRLAIVADGDDVIFGGEGDDQLFGQAGHDLLDAGEGNNYVEGNGGDDRINSGAGNDFLIGDDQFNAVPWETAHPNVAHGLHLIEQGSNGGLQLGTFGTVITPTVTLTAHPQQGFLPILAVDQERQERNPLALGLTTNTGLSVEPLIQLVPAVAGHAPWLPGNDNLVAGAGQDTLIGDDYLRLMPLRTGEAALDQALEELTRELAQLSYDLHDVELGRGLTQPGQTLSLGNDILDGGADQDLVVGDRAIALGPLETGLPITNANLANRLADLRAVTAQFDAQVLAIVADLVADTTPPTSGPNQLRQGNDNISGGEGDDHLFGDDSLWLSPVLDSLPYVNGSFWDYGFSQQERTTSPNLPAWNRDQGNDIINGAGGNDFVVGDYGSLITPVVPVVPTNETVLLQSLEQLKQDVEAFLRDLYADDYGIAHEQRDQSYILRAGNDFILGEAGADLLLGDSATLLLPWIAGQVDLSRTLQESYLDGAEEDYNFRHGLPRQHQLAYRSLDLNTTLAQDVIFGGLDNDLLFGQRGLDQLFGEAGDDALFGGSDEDVADGGVGNNVVRASNPSPKDGELIDPEVNAQLLRLLSPQLLLQLQELTQAQASAVLAGKFRLEASG